MYQKVLGGEGLLTTWYWGGGAKMEAEVWPWVTRSQSSIRECRSISKLAFGLSGQVHFGNHCFLYHVGAKAHAEKKKASFQSTRPSTPTLVLYKLLKCQQLRPHTFIYEASSNECIIGPFDEGWRSLNLQFTFQVPGSSIPQLHSVNSANPTKVSLLVLICPIYNLALRYPSPLLLCSCFNPTKYEILLQVQLQRGWMSRLSSSWNTIDR